MNTAKLNLNRLAIALVIAMSFLLVASCKKDKNADNSDASTNIVQDDNYASNTFQDVNDLVDEAVTSSGLKSTSSNYTVLSDCATISVNITASSSKIVIDFGSTGCTGSDNKVRKGKITTTYSGDYWADGSVKTTSFDNYYVDNKKITGMKIITTGAKNSAGNRFYTDSVSGAIQWANGDSSMFWQSKYSCEQTEGSSTLRIADDAYQISGYSSGTDAAGEKYSAKITTPLVRKVEFGCRYNYVQGVIEITPIGKSTRILDYGDGACDRKATVTISGNVYDIFLR